MGFPSRLRMTCVLRNATLWLAACVLPLAAQVPLAGGEQEAVVATSLGTFRLELFPDKAPQHVGQFVKLAREGYYDGSAFHFAVMNGAIQGGDPLLKDPATPREKWGTGGMSVLAAEPPTDKGAVKLERGVMALVRAPVIPNVRPLADSAQMIIFVTPQPALEGQYTAFARVNEGIEVVDRISQSPLDAKGLLVEPVRIMKVSIEPKKVAPFLNASLEKLRRTVTLKTTLGTIKIQTTPEWAPENVRAFLNLTASGWYDGTEFHRIAKGFLVQGGMGYSRTTGRAPTPTHAADRWVHDLPAEFRADVKHVRGIVSMAHGENPNSATTSFFIMLGASTALDNQYSAFGRMIAGDEVLAAFEKEDVDGEKPKRRIEIIEAGVE